MYENRTKTQSYDPSPTAWVVILLLTIMFEAALILVPAIRAEASGQTGKNATMVPKYGTAEYDRFTKDFEAKNGRPYDIHDQMAAMKNGGHVLMAYLGIGFAFAAICLTVYDNACWLQHRRVYRPNTITAKPRDARTQAIRTGLALAGAALLGMWYPLLPWLLSAHG